MQYFKNVNDKTKENFKLLSCENKFDLLISCINKLIDKNQFIYCVSDFLSDLCILSDLLSYCVSDTDRLISDEKTLYKYVDCDFLDGISDIQKIYIDDDNQCIYIENSIDKIKLIDLINGIFKLCEKNISDYENLIDILFRVLRIQLNFLKISYIENLINEKSILNRY